MSLPVKIGNYRFERNLGNGTFGKVKCKLNLNILGFQCIDRHILWAFMRSLSNRFIFKV